ncbi:Molybdenum cofactor guanylyltransferase (EC [Olavius sp. associated proteobacterium Delta 1]|nr:Molybdenum cofactor guanylyltransferase (EC [Olavius sp. associated proteobacterium Delta 1]
MMTHPCTGVILSGGLSTRFNGQNKAFISVGGKRILDRLYSIFSDLFDEIILVTNDPMQFVEWDLTIVTDIFPVRSSLTGIHAGLFYMKNQFAFFSACDTPFLEKGMVEVLLENIDRNIDIIMPETSAGMEPLCAIYSKRCLNTAENHIKQNKFKIQRALRNHRLKKISETVLRSKDPALTSFFNINTPEDLATAEKIAAGGRGH